MSSFFFLADAIAYLITHQGTLADDDNNPYGADPEAQRAQRHGRWRSALGTALGIPVCTKDAHACMCAHALVCVYACTRVRVYTRARAHTHTHTHTQGDVLVESFQAGMIGVVSVGVVDAMWLNRLNVILPPSSVGYAHVLIFFLGMSHVAKPPECPSAALRCWVHACSDMFRGGRECKSARECV